MFRNVSFRIEVYFLPQESEHKIFSMNRFRTNIYFLDTQSSRLIQTLLQHVICNIKMLSRFDDFLPVINILR